MSQENVGGWDVTVVTETAPDPRYAGDVAEVASPEKVDWVKQGYEFWNGGTPDLMLDLYAEDGELDLSAVFTDMSVYRGRESMRRQLDALWEAWEGVRMDPLAVFDVGGGRVVVDLRWWGKGRRSGVGVDQRLAFLYTLRAVDNKIVRSQLFPSVEAAMEYATGSEAVAGTADRRQ
jgi:ketosteroid isomerase-like protein